MYVKLGLRIVDLNIINIKMYFIILFYYRYYKYQYSTLDLHLRFLGI